MATLVTNYLTNCCLVDLIDMTLGCEDANSILVEVGTVDAETRVDCWGICCHSKETIKVANSINENTFFSNG